MRHHPTSVWPVVGTALAVLATASGGAGLGAVSRLAERFESFLVIGADSAGVRIAYADARGHIHVYRYKAGEPVLVWESTTLGSPASGLVVKDADGDGRAEIIVATSAGRILFYDAGSYELVWENGQDRFDAIRCMLVDNVDEDQQDELILVTGSHLVFFDGLTKLVEWKGEGFSEVRAMVLGNVDEDEQRELVLSTGVVFDTRHHHAEFEGQGAFGERLGLLDLTGDGIPEVMGEEPSGRLRVYDVYRQRELW